MMRWIALRAPRKGAIVIMAGLAAAAGQGCAGSASGGGSAASTAPSSPAPTTSSPPEPVTYTAQVFMRGMKVTVPTDGWTVFEDHPGEFNLSAPAPGAMTGTNIHFWLDPYVSTTNDQPNHGVGRTPTALIAWLKNRAVFHVSATSRRKIAGSVRALSVDLESTTPTDYFAFRGPDYSFPYGTGPGEPIRLYFATLGSGASAHTFVISIDAPSAKAFAAVAPTAENILASVKLPPTGSAG